MANGYSSSAVSSRSRPTLPGHHRHGAGGASWEFGGRLATLSATTTTGLGGVPRGLNHLNPPNLHLRRRGYNTSLRELAVRPRPVNFGFRIVPEKSAVVVERFGKFHAVLNAGIHILIPFVDQIAYVWHLKEEAISVANQTAVTQDNVAITIDGVLYVKVVDPEAASYGVENPIYAVSQLAQTTMRSEIGKMSLDKTFEERDHLNARIVSTINEAARSWGLECLRYEIRDILPPAGIKAAMEMQAEAERRKRATVLESEAEREAQVNRAEGVKQKVILEATAEAESIKVRAAATAAALATVGEELTAPGGGGMEAARVRVAEMYLKEFGRIAKAGNTVLLPADAGNPAAMVSQAMAAMGATSAATGMDMNNNNNPGLGGGFGFGSGGGGSMRAGGGNAGGLKKTNAGSGGGGGTSSVGGESYFSPSAPSSHPEHSGHAAGSSFDDGAEEQDEEEEMTTTTTNSSHAAAAATRLRLRAAARRALEAEAGVVSDRSRAGADNNPSSSSSGQTILSSGGGGSGGSGGGGRVRLSSD